MKRTRSRRATRSIAGLGVAIDDSRDLTKQCSSAIVRVLGRTYVAFSELLKPYGEKQYVLSGPDIIEIVTDRSYSAIQLYADTLTKFWLAASLKTEFQGGKEYLRSVCITIFTGNLTEDKTPLLRAEWDCVQDSKGTQHAQPHWHVYGSRFIETGRGQARFEPEGKVEEFDPARPSVSADEANRVAMWEEREKFHFAMIALWCTHGMDAHVHRAQADHIAAWLEGCLSYILEQLRYLCPSLSV